MCFKLIKPCVRKQLLLSILRPYGGLWICMAGLCDPQNLTLTGVWNHSNWNCLQQVFVKLSCRKTTLRKWYQVSAARTVALKWDVHLAAWRECCSETTMPHTCTIRIFSDHNAVRVWSKHVRNYHAKPLMGRWSGSRIELLRYTRKDPKSIQWPKPVYVKPKKLAVKDEFAPSSVMKKIWQWAVSHVLKFWLSPGLMTNDHFILLHKSWFQVSPAIIETWTPSIQ